MNDAGRESIFRKAIFHFHCYRSDNEVRRSRNSLPFLCNFSYRGKSGKAFFPCLLRQRERSKKENAAKVSRGLREKWKWRLFNVKFSIIYWILLHYNALYTSSAHTKQRTKEWVKMRIKRIHFAQSRIKFLLNFCTFIFIPLVSWENGKFIDWSIVNLEIIETALLLRFFKSSNDEETTPTLETSKCNKIYIKNISSSFCRSLSPIFHSDHHPQNDFQYDSYESKWKVSLNSWILLNLWEFSLLMDVKNLKVFKTFLNVSHLLMKLKFLNSLKNLLVFFQCVFFIGSSSFHSTLE